MLQFGRHTLTTDRCLVMGVLNVTPDSFSDGGHFERQDIALSRAEQMIAEGADIVDVGGESTRPGAAAVPVQAELDRVAPIVERLCAEFDVPVSIDTSKAEVMRAAARAGACIVNDVRALREEGTLDSVRDLDVGICLMHMLGQPRTMQQAPEYSDVCDEVAAFLQGRVDACVAAGIARERLLVDPGFGFGKTLQHNLDLLRHLERLVHLGLPVVVGMSRKTMLGQLLDRPVDQRLYGGLALAVLARQNGAAVVRTHDVAPTIDVLKVVEAVAE